MPDDPLLPFFCFFLLLVGGVGAGAGVGGGTVVVRFVVAVVVVEVLLPAGVLDRGGEGPVLSPPLSEAVDADRLRLLPSLSDMVGGLFPGGGRGAGKRRWVAGRALASWLVDWLVGSRVFVD